MTEGSLLDSVKAVALYLAMLAAFVPVVWAAAEAIGSAALDGSPERTRLKQRAAMILGPLLGVFALAMGFLPLRPTIFVEVSPAFDMTVNFAWSAFSGFLATFGARKLNDRVAKPLGIQIPGAKD